MEETRLNTLLKERHMSARKLALNAGIKYGTLYDVASGKRPLNGMAVRHAQAIAHALGMSVEELLGDEPPKLSADEAELLAVYRSLPTFAQKMALAMVRNIAEGLSDD